MSMLLLLLLLLVVVVVLLLQTCRRYSTSLAFNAPPQSGKWRKCNTSSSVCRGAPANIEGSAEEGCSRGFGPPFPRSRSRKDCLLTCSSSNTHMVSVWHCRVRSVCTHTLEEVRV